ncbi:hypothetical protein PBV87_10335 [Niameybacter massiliensis]|uniref:Uncharacterized protein n=1 Tax=Holtiella tumoricola TaxID=3018743 RepID=A0AA42DNG0_9FIRM|nr:MULTISPECIES: hypothetical protein [Lachnospirales]MDA3731876.1 hypothetical protein [Holtiella tumoricola]
MLRRINQEILMLQEEYIHPDRIAKKMNEAKKLLEDTRYELRSLEKSLVKENLDVEKIEKGSLTSIFYKCLGQHQKKVEKEKAEALAAKLKYDACKIREENLVKDMSKLSKEHYKMSKIQEEIDKLKEQKRNLVENSNSVESQLIQKLRQEIVSLKNEIKEINEAISPGRSATYALNDALDLLNSAGSWGTFDLLGGDLMADMMKHSKIDQAKGRILEAQTYLQRLRVELQDVNMQIYSSIEVSQGAVLADFFFDGLIADWYMQSKIKQSKENVAKIFGEVTQVVNALSKQLNEKEKSLQEKERKIERLIEQA